MSKKSNNEVKENQYRHLAEVAYGEDSIKNVKNIEKNMEDIIKFFQSFGELEADAEDDFSFNPFEKSLKACLSATELNFGLNDGKPCTLQETGDRLGITREQVRIRVALFLREDLKNPDVLAVALGEKSISELYEKYAYNKSAGIHLSASEDEEDLFDEFE